MNRNSLEIDMELTSIVSLLCVRAIWPTQGVTLIPEHPHRGLKLDRAETDLLGVIVRRTHPWSLDHVMEALCWRMGREMNSGSSCVVYEIMIRIRSIWKRAISIFREG